MTLALLLFYRVALPIRDFFRYELRSSSVAAAAPGVTSIEVGGRGLHRLHAVAGQFMLWRFLTPGRWWQAHPFSLSAMPDGRTLRLTAKAVGDFTQRARTTCSPGTRVMVEGPFGVLTSAAMRTDKALLIAGGIGITPLRALFEELARSIDVVLIYRAVAKREFVLREELEEIAARWGATLHLLPGDHNRREGTNLLSPAEPPLAACRHRRARRIRLRAAGDDGAVAREPCRAGSSGGPDPQRALRARRVSAGRPRDAQRGSKT